MLGLVMQWLSGINSDSPEDNAFLPQGRRDVGCPDLPKVLWIC